MKRRIKKRREHRRTGLGLIAVIVFLLCGLISFKRMELDAKVTKCKEQLATENREKETQEKRAKDLEEYKAYIQTDQFIEEVAREKLGLVYEDEIIFESKN